MFAHNRRDNSACKPRGWWLVLQVPTRRNWSEARVSGKADSARVFVLVKSVRVVRSLESHVRRDVFIKSIVARRIEGRRMDGGEKSKVGRDDRSTKPRNKLRATSSTTRDPPSGLPFSHRWSDLRCESLHPRTFASFPRTDKLASFSSFCVRFCLRSLESSGTTRQNRAATSSRLFCRVTRRCSLFAKIVPEHYGVISRSRDASATETIENGRRVLNDPRGEVDLVARLRDARFKNQGDLAKRRTNGMRDRGESLVSRTAFS